MHNRHSAMLAALLLGAALPAAAHLDPLTTPKAGDSYSPGAKVTLAWGIGSAHNTIDLALSTDGGATWSNITTGLPANTKSFVWTVPATASTQAKVRVCQRDGAQVQGCTNAHNTQALTRGIAVTGGEVYTAISPVFTIQPGASLASLSAAPGAAALRPGAFPGNIEVSFRLPGAAHVILEAFDARGRLAATLLDEVKAEGAHAFSIQSHALAVAGPLHLRLRAGDQEAALALDPAR